MPWTGFAIAQRHVGDTLVSVSANGNNDVATLLTIVETLATVHEDQLPGDVLTPTPEALLPVRDVRRHRRHCRDVGIRSQWEVLQSDDLDRIDVTTCVLTLDIEGEMSAVNGGGSMRLPGAPTMLVEAVASQQTPGMAF